MKKKTVLKATNLHKGSVFEFESDSPNVYVVIETYNSDIRLYDLINKQDLGWTTRALIDTKTICQKIESDLDSYTPSVKKQFSELRNKNEWLGIFRLIYYRKVDSEKAIICFINQYDSVCYGYGDLEGNIFGNSFTLLDYDLLTKIPLESL